ncbi:N-terminal phage integrase SAM-like domain-containing protein [Furfurilactobacillus siliginis]|uniref:N-terminal phage integrase SAM-like domain-containing protein n=1 Tax=Furfurilactobacillus siliginis TaxID=348151 RepID=UPI0009F9844C
MNFAEANAKAKQIESDYFNNKVNSSHYGELSIEDYLNMWLDKIDNRVKIGTLIRQRFVINHYIIPNTGRCRLKDYSLQDHQRFINSLFTNTKYGRLDPNTGKKQGLRWHTCIRIQWCCQIRLRRCKSYTLCYLSQRVQPNK